MESFESQTPVVDNQQETSVKCSRPATLGLGVAVSAATKRRHWAMAFADSGNELIRSGLLTTLVL